MSALTKWSHARRGLICVLTIGYLSINNPVCAQTPVINSISNYNQAINAIETDQGSYASSLSDLYLGLGRALVDQENFEKAKRAFEQGMHVIRINKGPMSISQSPYLLSLADTESFLGNWKQARSALNNFYRINQQAYGAQNPRMLPVLDQLLDWFMTTYEQRTTVGGYENLIVAERIAESVKTILLKDTDLEQAPNRYQRIANLHYMIADHLRQYGDTSGSGINFSTGGGSNSNDRLTTSNLHFERGKYALEQVLESLIKQDKNNIAQQAIAIAQLGDWYLIFNQRQAAKKAYKLASDTLKTTNSPQASHLELFNRPSIIEFTVNNPRKKQNLEPEIEISFSISSLGRISDIQVVNPQDQITKKQLNYFKRKLRHTRFRPKLVDGETVTSVHREFFPLSVLEK